MEDGKEIGTLTPAFPVAYWNMALTRDGSRLVAGRSYPKPRLDVWDLRLIGEQLAERGLKQDWPDIPPASHSGRPLTICFDTNRK